MSRDMTEISIVASEVRGSLKADAPLADNIATAMKIGAHHWMVLEDDPQFRGAVGGLLLFYADGTPEHERILADYEGIKRVSAMLAALQAGVPVDVAAMADEEPQQEPLHLLQSFKDAKRAGASR